jgi:hypothetical protein
MERIENEKKLEKIKKSKEAEASGASEEERRIKTYLTDLLKSMKK